MRCLWPLERLEAGLAAEMLCLLSLCLKLLQILQPLQEHRRAHLKTVYHLVLCPLEHLDLILQVFDLALLGVDDLLHFLLAHVAFGY